MNETITKSNVPLPTPIVPPQSLLLLNHIRYEFKVQEHVDEEGKVRRANLCVRKMEYDNNGILFNTHAWEEVHREKISWIPE